MGRIHCFREVHIQTEVKNHRELNQISLIGQAEGLFQNIWAIVALELECRLHFLSECHYLPVCHWHLHTASPLPCFPKLHCPPMSSICYRSSVPSLHPLSFINIFQQSSSPNDNSTGRNKLSGTQGIAETEALIHFTHIQLVIIVITQKRHEKHREGRTV